MPCPHEVRLGPGPDGNYGRGDESLDLVERAREAVAAMTPSPARDVATKIDPATIDVEELARFLYEHCPAMQVRAPHDGDYCRWTDPYVAERTRECWRAAARAIVRDLDDLEPILARLYVASGRF